MGMEVDRNEEIDKDESDMREDMRLWRRYVNTMQQVG